MKYIVEFEDEPCMYEDDVHFYKCIQAPWWGLNERVIKHLTPYQPDAPDTNVDNITNLCAHENDPISRRMAIDALAKFVPYVIDDVSTESYTNGLTDAYNLICQLPSVQPDHVADVSKKVDVDDCISRRAVKEKLKQNLTYMRAFGVDRCINLIDEIPAVESEPKWIPCSERLPEEGQKCLVYDKAIGFRVDTYIGHGNPYNWELFVRDYEAWMPLPSITGVMLSE